MLILLSGTISTQLSSQIPVSPGVQDVYAQEYKDQQNYGDDKSYGKGGDTYYSNSYDKGYDSYDKKKVLAELETFDNKLFVCDNGIVVDDRINCPQKCPFNTPLEGVYVMDLDVCNIQPGVGVTCPENTDLPGVVVTEITDCNIFFQCDATTPLGVSLQGQDVKVADPALCQLASIANLQVCQSGPFEGFVVSEEDVCDAMEGVQICAPGTDLQGMLTSNPATCNVFEECVTGDPIFSAIPGGDAPFKVVDSQICQLQVPEGVQLFNCPENSENPFAIVTDLQLCDAPGDGNICGDTTDLPGVYVANADIQCNIFEQCITGDPIFDALPGGDSPFDVADRQICELTIPADGGADCPNCNLVFELCPPGTDLAGAYVSAAPENCEVEGDPATGEVCPPGTQLEGAFVDDTATDCDILFKCPEDSLLARQNVTSLDLCNVVDVELKECQTCAALVNHLNGDSTANTVFNSISAFNNPTNGKSDLLGICTSDNPLTAYHTMIDLTNLDASTKTAFKNQFTACVTGEDEMSLPLTINKDWFVCNNDDIDCTITIPEEQISFQVPGSGMYTECTSEQDCPFVIDAAFNIGITGNNPVPNKIPAQVDTTQQVVIGTGPFDVSEELFSGELVPNANIDIDNVPVGQIGGIFPALIISFDEAGQRLFTGNFDGDSVSIIDLNNANNVITIPLLPSGGNGPVAIVFDEAGQRLFTANLLSSTVSIIELNNANNVINVPLLPSGGQGAEAIAFDQTGQRVFTANFVSDSVSIIDLNNGNAVTDVDLVPSGGEQPVAIAFDEIGDRVFTANEISDSVSIIDLDNANSVTNVPLNGGNFPIAITFDQPGQRVFTANQVSHSLSIIDLANANTVTDVDLAPSGADEPVAVAFDEVGQRVFTANAISDSLSIIDLDNANTVTDVDLAPSGADEPVALAVDEAGGHVYTANRDSNSVSIINLNNANSVIDIDLGPSGANSPRVIIFDESVQRVFTANVFSNSVSIIDLPTVAKICQGSGFDTGDIRTFVSGQQTLEQITCVNFVGECTGDIQDGDIKECTVQDYAIRVIELPESIIVPIEPTGALPNWFGNPPTTVDLAANNINPGDTITISYSGLFNHFSPSACASGNGYGPDEGIGYRLAGQFSSSSGVIGSNFVIEPTGSSFPVPLGATHILLAVADSLSFDNCGDVIATITIQQ